MVVLEVRPKDSYFAKRCPERVQLDVLRPCEPAPDSPFLQKLIRAGDEYEGSTLADVFDGMEGAVFIDADDADAREWHTMQAIEQGRGSSPGVGCRRTTTPTGWASPTFSSARATVTCPSM